MAKASRKRKRRGGAPKKRSGMMIGMRGGFKKMAQSVTGASAGKEKKSSALSNALWFLVLLAAVGFFLYRRIH
jgi:hypothetical protein